MEKERETNILGVGGTTIIQNPKDLPLTNIVLQNRHIYKRYFYGCLFDFVHEYYTNILRMSHELPPKKRYFFHKWKFLSAINLSHSATLSPGRCDSAMGLSSYFKTSFFNNQDWTNLIEGSRQSERRNLLTRHVSYSSKGRL